MIYSDTFQSRCINENLDYEESARKKASVRKENTEKRRRAYVFFEKNFEHFLRENDIPDETRTEIDCLLKCWANSRFGRDPICCKAQIIGALKSQELIALFETFYTNYDQQEKLIARFEEIGELYDYFTTVRNAYYKDKKALYEVVKNHLYSSHQIATLFNVMTIYREMEASAV